MPHQATFALLANYSERVKSRKNEENGSVRRQPWDLFIGTLLAELFGLAWLGVIALVAWPLGGLTYVENFGVMAVVGYALEPMTQLYRSRPPRRHVALIAALLPLVAATLLTHEFAPSPLADHDLDLFAGGLIALPISTAVFSWVVTRANVA